MKNVLYENNVVLHTGYGHGGGRYRTSGGMDAMCGANLPERAENFVIRNNIFDGSKDNLITAIAAEKSYLPKMSGNTYIHREDAKFGYWFVRNANSLVRFDSDIKNKMIELDSVAMQWDNHIALQNVSLTINEGDFLAITGPNGGGKTTLLRLILRLIKPTSGKVIYRSYGKEVENLEIGYLPQKNQIDSRFPITVEEVVSLGLMSQKKLSKQERKEKVSQTIALMGLEEHANRLIGELSGGQLQRTLLGRAIVSNPRVLVLDEPLSYVDKSFEGRLYDIIAQLAKHTTIILVSHEMTRIATMANRHIIIDRTLHECSAEHHYIATECN
jgi:zinc transport system ATP-binding protein